MFLLVNTCPLFKRILSGFSFLYFLQKFILNTASIQRKIKSWRSEIDGGLKRTVTVYDYNGKEIRHWTGKFDVSESESETYFDDEDGKRVVIHGGIVINEEQ